MFQREVNKFFQKDVYNSNTLKRMKNKKQKLAHECGITRSSVYDNYLCKTDTTATLSHALQAFCFNSTYYNHNANQMFLGGYNYTRPLTPYLASKIVRNIPNSDFMKCIYQEFYDHQNLLTVDFEDYENYRKALAYILVFDVCYMHDKLSNKELSELSQHTTGRIIVDNVKDKDYITLHIIKNKDKIETTKFLKSPEGIIKLLLTAFVPPKVITKPMFERLDSKTILKLWDILKITDQT